MRTVREGEDVGLPEILRFCKKMAKSLQETLKANKYLALGFHSQASSFFIPSCEMFC